MPSSGWGRFWRPERLTPPLPGVVTRAAVSGAEIAKLLELAAEGFLQAGAADRAGVWLDMSKGPVSYLGTVVEAAPRPIPEEWKRLDISLPFFGALLESRETVRADVDDGSMPVIGPLIGMRTAAWVPLRVRQRTLGVAMLAHEHYARSLDTGLLQMLADEISLAVAQWRDSEMCASQQAELESLRTVTSATQADTLGRSGPLTSAETIPTANLSALRELDESKKNTEAELFCLLDSVESGVMMFDAAGNLRLVNDRFGQMMGVDAQRITQLGSFNAIVNLLAGHFVEPRGFADRWRELFRRGDEASWDELELMRPTRKVLERFARPVLGGEGERIGWLEVYRDITGQRLIQSKLLQTEKMAALGQLVSGIAHELSNPLTSIQGYAQLLLSRAAGPERGSDARMIYEEAERAGRIVRNLLLFARETKPARSAVNLNEIVERTLALRSYELKVENIHVDFDLDPELPTTLADVTQMQQVVLNLVVNAEQAIQQGRGQGYIHVRTMRISGEHLALEVADDGPGIPPEIASRIFDPFFTTKPVGVGTGLGLSIVYGIVQQHGGEISVRSQPGRGTTFLMELPVVAAPPVNTEEGQSAPLLPAHVNAGDESGQPELVPRERILVVEDEPTVARLIADVLLEEGYAVDTVLDSREGLERIGRQHYDLVICDLKMPHVDGRAFYRALVRAGSPLQQRIVFVTGDTLSSHTLEFLDSSGLTYLAKPFLVEELKLAVQRALSSPPHRARVAAGGSARKR